MKIYDIPQGTKITINMVHNKTSYTVEATVLTRYGDGMLITPITCGGEKIDFSVNANFEYSETFSGRKHMFQADTISRVDFAGSDFHVITGREIVVADNQRKAERFRVQAMGNAIFNKKEFMSVIMHDISMRGFSLIVGKNARCQVGDKVKLDFCKDANSPKMTISGVVVRNFSIGGYEAVGCEMENISPQVVAFVMEKKAEHMRKNGTANTMTTAGQMQAAI